MEQSRLDLSNQRILITGAAGGIGAATARACVAMGVSELVLADIDPMEEISDELNDGQASIKVVQCDISQRQDNTSLVASAGRIDAAVSCAGICPLEEDWLDDPEWDQVFNRSWM